jgi:hypothetical protein
MTAKPLLQLSTHRRDTSRGFGIEVAGGNHFRFGGPATRLRLAIASKSNPRKIE